MLGVREQKVGVQNSKLRVKEKENSELCFFVCVIIIFNSSNLSLLNLSEYLGLLQ